MNVRDETVNFLRFLRGLQLYISNQYSFSCSLSPTLRRLCQNAASVSIVCLKSLAVKIIHMFELINRPIYRLLAFVKVTKICSITKSDVGLKIY